MQEYLKASKNEHYKSPHTLFPLKDNVTVRALLHSYALFETYSVFVAEKRSVSIDNMNIAITPSTANSSMASPKLAIALTTTTASTVVEKKTKKKRSMISVQFKRRHSELNNDIGGK